MRCVYTLSTFLTSFDAQLHFYFFVFQEKERSCLVPCHIFWFCLHWHWPSCCTDFGLMRIVNLPVARSHIISSVIAYRTTKVRSNSGVLIHGVRDWQLATAAAVAVQWWWYIFKYYCPPVMRDFHLDTKQVARSCLTSQIAEIGKRWWQPTSSITRDCAHIIEYLLLHARWY